MTELANRRLAGLHEGTVSLSYRTWIVHVSSELKSTIGSPPLAISILFCGRNRATTAMSHCQFCFLAGLANLDVSPLCLLLGVGIPLIVLDPLWSMC